MSTPTPRTDSEEYPEGEGQSFHVVSADFARTLERELTTERKTSRLLRVAMDVRDEGYTQSRRRMIALESEVTAKGQAVRNLAEVISGQDKELEREREKVRVLREACERIEEQWDKNHSANPFHAGNVMQSHAMRALAATEDGQ
jgi:uncharacterized coiled-coil protein SlyX